MRIALQTRLGTGALAMVAAVAGLGSFDRPDDPARRLSCPSGARDVRLDASDGGWGGGAPRQQVLDHLPYSAVYTQAHMTGRLDEHRTSNGLTEVTARGPRHEPIAIFRFGRERNGWQLRYSAECGLADADADAARAADPFNHVVCPGYLIDGIIDYDPGPVDHDTPQQKLRGQPDFGPGRVSTDGYPPSFTTTHATGPWETRYRFEATKAAVIVRDAHRRPIAVYRFDRTPAGWRMSGMGECSNDGLDPPLA